jgi:hypothetical protein
MPYKDKEKEKARKREWYQNNKDYFKEYARINKTKIDANFRLSHVKRLYNLNADEYLQMLLDQDNKCLICKKAETNKNCNGDIRPLSVDHCHTTGRVRGLLCNQCNAGLGNFKDNLESLRSAVEYLSKFEEN